MSWEGALRHDGRTKMVADPVRPQALRGLMFAMTCARCGGQLGRTNEGRTTGLWSTTIVKCLEVKCSREWQATVTLSLVSKP